MPSGPHDLRSPVRGVSSHACLFLILGTACAILFGHLGLLPLWGSEGRWGVISRNMLQSGNLLIPMLDNAPYWDKPLVSYWQVLPMAHVLGGVDELAARIPSALWAVVLLLLTHDLARRWLGATGALVSTALLATSYGFVFWGRNAQVEMTNAAVILLILWYFFTRKDSGSPFFVLVLAALMGMGANMKGLTAVGVPAFCILACSLADHDWEWLPGPGAVASAALVFSAAFFIVPLAGCLYSSSGDPLRLVWKENVVRFFAPFDHKGPFYLYCYRIFDLGAPWSLFLPPALAYFLRRREYRERGIRNALAAFAAIFLFFSLSGSRRSYYLLPILPFASMIAGDFLSRFIRQGLPRGMDAFTRAAGILLASLFALPLILLLLKPGALPESAGCFLPWALAFPLAGALMAQGFLERRFTDIILPAFSAWLFYVFVLVPWQAALPGNIRDEAARINALKRPVAFLTSSESRVIFYLEKPCTVLPDLAGARAWAERTDGILIADEDIRDPSWVSFIHDRDMKAYILKAHPGYSPGTAPGTPPKAEAVPGVRRSESFPCLQQAWRGCTVAPSLADPVRALCDDGHGPQERPQTPAPARCQA
jgi:4-amino-4-deoxy-L-arabinose transferase-like glycosyltransferase